MFSADESLSTSFGACALWNNDDCREISFSESFEILLKYNELCCPK